MQDAHYCKPWNPSTPINENFEFAIGRGRQKVADVFGALPHRRHIVVSTTYADYLLCLLKRVHPQSLEWALARARRAVAFVAFCRRHEGGEFTRLLVAVFDNELPDLTAIVTADEGSAERAFDTLVGADGVFRFGSEFIRGRGALSDLSWVAP